MHVPVGGVLDKKMNIYTILTVRHVNVTPSAVQLSTSEVAGYEYSCTLYNLYTPMI